MDTVEQTQNGIVIHIPEPTPKYTSAEVVSEIVARLIRNDFSYLRDCRFTFLFRNNGWDSKGRTILGQVRKVSEIDNAIMCSEVGLEDIDIVMILNGDKWKDLSTMQREALIAHELCHVEIADKGYGLVPHDVEEFARVVKRYGLWKNDLQQMGDAARAYEQEHLPGVAGKP
jgi:predicted metallopeptidase